MSTNRMASGNLRKVGGQGVKLGWQLRFSGAALGPKDHQGRRESPITRPGTPRPLELHVTSTVSRQPACPSLVRQRRTPGNTYSFFLTRGPFSLVSSPPKKPLTFSVLADVFFSSRSAMSFFSANQLLADFK